MKSPLSLLFVWTLLGVGAVLLARIAMRRATRGDSSKRHESGRFITSGVNYLVGIAIALWVILILLYIFLR
jgi:hypothetical protein